MEILIGYATTEGQTRKVARFCADQLVDAGHSVELLALTDASDLEVSRFDAVILGASVHGQTYQTELTGFATDHAAALMTRPTLFLSVSLSAAGEDPGDWKGLEALVAEFTETTGWTPDRVEHVAGAFRFGEYDFFRAWAMRWIAKEKGETVDPHGDTEYTDWDRLAAALTDWLKTAGAEAQ